MTNTIANEKPDLATGLVFMFLQPQTMSTHTLHRLFRFVVNSAEISQKLML